jgi:hypothetical protein
MSEIFNKNIEAYKLVSNFIPSRLYIFQTRKQRSNQDLSNFIRQSNTPTRYYTAFFIFRYCMNDKHLKNFFLLLRHGTGRKKNGLAVERKMMRKNKF